MIFFLPYENFFPRQTRLANYDGISSHYLISQKAEIALSRTADFKKNLVSWLQPFSTTLHFRDIFLQS